MKLGTGTVRACAVVVLLLGGLAALIPGQMRERVWARYEREMQDPVEDPPDALRKAEFALGRLRYRSPMDRAGRRYFRWGIDANKGDRTFISLLARLTRIDVQPIETIVDISSDEMFQHPWMMAGSVGDWRIAPQEAARMRQYFERGGFLMVDDFHNEREWANFMAGIEQMYPGAEVEEMENADAAFHVVFDQKKRIRVPGANVVDGDQIERGGVEPHWRAIRDSKGHMIIAICFNMDVGDGWEYADDPQYPEKYGSEAMRLGVNYVAYAMTH
ncbi:MAG: DUF4159 domain-containing protein [Bryobacterales bacterium]|nr:DUF4159 domain-containing protein [Bryobacterales bacterium]